MDEPIGEVTHYYRGIGVAVVKLHADLEVGDFVAFAGHTTDFEHQPIGAAAAGTEVAVKVADRVREGDLVFRAE